MIDIKMPELIAAFYQDEDVENAIQGIEYGDCGDSYILNLEYYDDELSQLYDMYFNLFASGEVYYEVKLAKDTQVFEFDNYVLNLFNKVTNIWLDFLKSKEII